MPLKAFTAQELKKIGREFNDQVSLAKNKKSNIRYDKNKINKNLIKSDQNIQVIYIGTSHIEFATLEIRSGERKLIDFTERDIPRIDSGDKLVDLILQDLNRNVEEVVVTFAAHLQTTNSKVFVDSVLRNNHRLHDLSFLSDEPVGKWLSKKVEERTGKKIAFSALNNLVSLGLSVDLKEQKNVILAVVASGVNMGFFEGNSIINLESGKFRWESSEVSNQIGEENLWKAYNRQAAQKKLKLLSGPRDFRKVLSSENDTEKSLAKLILKRSAQLVAAKFYGLIRNLGWHNEKVQFIVEGSLFWEIANYRELVFEAMASLGVDFSSLEFIRNKNGFLAGSSKIFAIKPVIERKQIQIIEHSAPQISILNWSPMAPPA